LCHCLEQNKLIQWVKDGLIYKHPTIIDEALPDHKYSDIVGIYLNEVLYNYQISHKQIYNTCEFVYLIRNPKTSVKILEPKDAIFALNYYIFRLRRIYEMTKETKGAIFLTWEDLVNNKGISLIAKKLNLSDNLNFKEIKSDRKLLDLPLPLLQEAERAYELCLYRVRSKRQLVMC
jgi:hypothetical protein